VRPDPHVDRRFDGDRGSTLAELVIAMGLTAMAMAALVGLISSSSGTVEEFSDDDARVAVALDWLAADLREATALDVVATAAGQATMIDIVSPAGTVRWGTTAGVVERTAPGAGSAQPVAIGLRTTEALRLELRTTAGVVVDPGDAAAVEACTRIVGIEIVDTSDVVIEQRAVSLRYPLWETETC
jgi:hypothetical protein